MPLTFIGCRLRKISVGLLAVHIAWVFCADIARAAGPAPAARYEIDQPAQPLSDSLRSIARQTGVSVLFEPGAVSGRMSHAVTGQFSAVEAIARALDGTGLTAEVTGENAIVVKPARAVPVSQDAVRSIQTAHVPDRGEVASNASGVQLAQAAGVPDAEGRPTAPKEPTVVAQVLQPVEVTGSRLKRVETDGPTPVNIYTRADIDQSGQPTIERFLNSLNEVSATTGEGGLGPTQGQGSVQLRGLPLGSTLVLINGRRVQAVGSSPANYFNLNLIPMAAVDRIEIVPVGSSAVYGGDALAGVVNIILKKSIDGFALDTRLASGRGTGDGGVSLATGGHDAEGSFLLLGSYSKTTPLTMAEREFFRDGDYRRFGGVDTRTRSCTPGTVSSNASGVKLPGLNSTFAGIPALGPGQSLSVSSFAATDGQANLCNPLANGNGTALVYGTEDYSMHGAVERQVAPGWSLFGELTVNHDKLSVEPGGLQLNNVLVPATNPYNPFGTAVRVTARLGSANGSESFSRNTDFVRAVVGARGDLGHGWDVEASLSTTRDDGEQHLRGSTKTAARAAALAATTPELALNPFTAGVAASPEVLNAIWPDSIRENHGRRDQGSAFIRGSVFQLPAGSVDVIAGAELTHDRYSTSVANSFNDTGTRTSSAVYGEMRAPLWKATGPDGKSWDLAALTVAARRDGYSDFGSASTYQAGAEFRPTRTLLLRGSAASSFKPPTLLETNVEDTVFTTEDYGLVDTAKGGAPIIGGEVVNTANKNLQPETGRAYSLGAVWEPDAASGTRLGVTAWRVKIKGLISLLWPQTAIDNESLFPGLVTRAPSVGGVPGDIVRVLDTDVNFGSIDTAGLDLEMSRSWRAAGAKWTLGASATRTTKYEVAIAPGAAAEDRLGRRAVDYWSPKWKGRVFAGFEQGPWTVGITSRYLGGYKDSAPSDRDLGNYWVHDLAVSVDLKRFGLSLGAIKEARLSLGVVNIANRLPQYVDAYPYYDITQADWRGRYANLRYSMTW